MFTPDPQPNKSRPFSVDTAKNGSSIHHLKNVLTKNLPNFEALSAGRASVQAGLLLDLLVHKLHPLRVLRALLLEYLVALFVPFTRLSAAVLAKRIYKAKS